MKGIELPISTLIIIAVALLVLLGIIALWMAGWGGGSTGVSVDTAKAAACGVLMRNVSGCTTVDPDSIVFNSSQYPVPDFDVDQDGVIREIADDTLRDLCDRYYRTSDDTSCRKVCGCGG